MARLRASWRTSPPAVPQPRNPQSQSIARSPYEPFPAAEAHRILERLEFHYTPKHASWLNMVEIEIGVLKGQCLDRRINNQEDLEREIAAWERQRNASGVSPR